MSRQNKKRYLVSGVVFGCIVIGILLLVSIKPLIFDLGYVLIMVAGMSAMASFASFQRFIGNHRYVKNRKTKQEQNKYLRIHLLIPYLNNSIKELSYDVDDTYFNLRLTPGEEGLLFNENDVILTYDDLWVDDVPSIDHIPELDIEKFKEIARIGDSEKLQQFVISLPHKGGFSERPIISIEDNYLHVTLNLNPTTLIRPADVRFRHNRYEL